MNLSLDHWKGKSRSSWIYKSLQQGFPHSKNEDFFYFPLGRLERNWNEPDWLSFDVDHILNNIPLDGSPCLVFLDGRLSLETSTPSILTYLKTKSYYNEKDELNIAEFEYDYFKALSFQYCSQIYTLSLTPDFVECYPHLNCIFIQTQSHVYSLPHLQCTIPDGIQSQLSVYYISQSAQDTGLQIPYLMLQLGKESSMDVNFVLNNTSLQSLFAYCDVIQEEKSSLKTWVSYINGGLTRMAISSCLNGREAKATFTGQYITNQSEQFEIFTRVFHKYPKTESNQFFKGICGEGGHFSFNGDIKVSEDCSGVESYQLSKNIIRHPTAKVYTRPQLNISHHDLKCTHGSTIGGISPDEVIYLQTRGISFEMAQNLTLLSFLEEISDQEPHSPLKLWIQKQLREKLGYIHE